ncbi:hypothetical protein HMJ29_06985 [Hymenobacter taeanensis]|uniref:Uncharacterized protein n=1 Tax=Hymenobacter taeanensis TaxID=2735321 RepID=A0A6M6BEN6_9BACT|nr:MULTISPECIES: hypothetical protein [Hymenobacter]QJX46696.1 hypothetical protein HMJ29_06985 [Hymenobacter taeanensis]UOQ80561.1 hypothetical protein MUN83_17330 [Hymenobacter sp. 5414T-23]
MFAVLLLSTSAKAFTAASFYTLLLLSACSPDGSGTDEHKQTAKQPKTATASAKPTAAAPGPTAKVVRLTNDSLAGQPFGPEPTVTELLSAGGTVVTRKPFRNLHEAGQIDTILLLRHRGNLFEFYRAPEKDLLRDASITNFETAYGRRLRSRMAAAHHAAAGATERIRIGDTERANYVSVTYSSGQVSAVHVEPYVD